ncbi:phytanoyl-CoA dioxygenase family protein [Hoeflea sp. TYP-13]|uniref:phytanoyl-CoA dioxygenase family protein n=1 Tax=Hoeflea sp. TYP-13 TaxID=3230023 RepID=UPI0034C5CCE5
MTATLTGEEIARYRDDGYIKPVTVFSVDEAALVRAEIEVLERDHDQGAGGHTLNQFFRVNGQVTIPLLAEIARTPAILDAVESILGPDLLVWSCELFIKEAGSEKIVSWHQDLTYWGMGETDEEVTAWIAFSDVSEAAGCMRFVPGSHKQRIQPHKDTFEGDNLLSRGQEVAVEVDEKDAVFDELKPGEMSLHHGRLFHASGPNRSADRRIGMAIRYVTPSVEQSVGSRDYAMLVRGADRSRNWINIAPPSTLFGEGSLALYDRILADQTAALTAGAARSIGLYTQSEGTAQ